MAAPWVSNKTAQDILIYVHYASPLILLAVFLVAFTAHSITTASKNEVAQPTSNQTGPGGKPLPRNPSPAAKAKLKKKALDFSPARKLLFGWLSVGATVTFLGNGVVVIVHALWKNKDNWWCGQSVVVCGHLPDCPEILAVLIRDLRST